MKRTVLTFGLISGAISMVLMTIILLLIDRIGFDTAEILGYTTLVLSFLLVFVGIKSYRDNVAGGTITFGKAFAVGLLITIVSCGFYVVTWEIMYFNLDFLSDFMDKYAAHIVEQAKASGSTPEAIQAQVKQMESFKKMFQNPLFNAAMTFMEPFPVGLIMTLVSAGILRTRQRKPAVTAANVVG